MGRVAPERSGAVRNVVLLLGLWAGIGLVSMPFAIAFNHLPAFVASPARPGSVLLLRVLSALPLVPGSLLGGAGVAFLFISEAAVRWATALALLVSLQYVGPLMRIQGVWTEPEEIAGVLLTLILLGGSVLGSYLVVRRRLRRAAVANAA